LRKSGNSEAIFALVFATQPGKCIGDLPMRSAISKEIRVDFTPALGTKDRQLASRAGDFCERNTMNTRYISMVKEFTVEPQAPLPTTTLAFPAHGAGEPTRWQTIMFLGKAWVFRARRAYRDRKPETGDRKERRALNSQGYALSESRSGLYSSESSAEFALQAGKVQNLRIAAAALNGLIIPAGEVFSFWKHVGRPVKSRGFVPGRELREGCVIPSIGGGLCQLSNALYGAALDANCEIVERHAHSRRLPGSMAAEGRDATVFWNYVDLRFRSAIPLRLEIHLTRRELVVRMLHCGWEGSPKANDRRLAEQSSEAKENCGAVELEPVESCETCGVTSCFRHGAAGKGGAHGATGWLVDAWWPEFDAYLQKERDPGDWLLLPLDGARWRVGSYRWKTSGFSRVRQAPWEVMIRSLVSRRLAAQGAERQRALLRFDEALARRYARALPFSATHLVVSLNLLPFLWRDGVLGGRTFDVLMTRQPLADLQSALDLAHELHPESRTLRDFRVSSEVVAAESEALAEARHWITPHRGVARLGGSKSALLKWVLPSIQPMEGEKTRIAFPASTLGRKGAYEVREVAKRLGLRLGLCGAVIESPDFWRDCDAAPSAGHWLSGAQAVVLPAWVEHQPRRLLQALAAGVPVIASQACGLEGLPGVISVPEGDAKALEVALRQVQAR
jgi:hypothetical protein